MSKIISVQTNENYQLLIAFADGSNISYNMQQLVNTLPYLRLRDPVQFQQARCEEKSVYWEPWNSKEEEYYPLRLSLDNILFSIRDSDP